MWLTSKKLMLAVEWTWLILGLAVMVSQLVEAWAGPYTPLLWALGLLSLFVAYRWDIVAHPISEPAVDVAEDLLAKYIEKGGDGLTSTTEWVPPQIRGREIPTDRHEKSADESRSAPSPPGVPSPPTPQAAGSAQSSRPEKPSPPVKLEISTDSGVFDRAERPTLFNRADAAAAQPDDGDASLDPTSRLVLGAGDLRAETEADMTDDEVVIPSFAESTMTHGQRSDALQRARARLQRAQPSAAGEPESAPSPKPSRRQPSHDQIDDSEENAS